MEPGTRVRFLSEVRRTIKRDESDRGAQLTDRVIGRGEEGIVITYPGQLPGGWILVRPDSHPDEYVPVHADMLEEV